jgi:ESCRT-II complex subunit VPS25
MSSNYPTSFSQSSTTLAPSVTPSTTASTKPPPKPPSDSTFTFPREYNFPPFFTRQTNSGTFHAQCTKWTSLILAYCRFHRIWKLSLVDAIDTDLFWNKKIGKRLAINDAREIVQFMKKEGRAEWIGNGRGGVEDGNVGWIWWRNPEEWAGAIAEWVDETGQKNTVLTLYELTESEATLSQGNISLVIYYTICLRLSQNSTGWNQTCYKKR